MSKLLRTALGACILFTVPQAFAHALLLTAIPAAGSVVAGPSITIELKFNSRIDGPRSRILLVSPDAKVSPLTVAPQRAPEILDAPASHLLPGTYKIRWQVLALDGHITRGEVPFRIR